MPSLKYFLIMPTVVKCNTEKMKNQHAKEHLNSAQTLQKIHKVGKFVYNGCLILILSYNLIINR